MEISQPGERHLGFQARRNGEVFSARKLSVEKNQLMDWDLCAFFLTQQFSAKTKKSKRSEGKERVEPKTVECMHFTLNFPTDVARDDFETKITRELTGRQRQHNDAMIALGIAHAGAQSPTVEVYPRNSGYRRDSMLSKTTASTFRSSSRVELPPIRRMPSISSSLFSDRNYSAKPG
jgi:hypothetical protein